MPKRTLVADSTEPELCHKKARTQPPTTTATIANREATSASSVLYETTHVPGGSSSGSGGESDDESCSDYGSGSETVTNSDGDFDSDCDNESSSEEKGCDSKAPVKDASNILASANKDPAVLKCSSCKRSLPHCTNGMQPRTVKSSFSDDHFHADRLDRKCISCLKKVDRMKEFKVNDVLFRKCRSCHKRFDAAKGPSREAVKQFRKKNDLLLDSHDYRPASVWCEGCYNEFQEMAIMARGDMEAEYSSFF